jgi:hypothetical protein
MAASAMAVAPAEKNFEDSLADSIAARLDFQRLQTHHKDG